MSRYQSWGRYFRYHHSVWPIFWRSEGIDFSHSTGPVLPYGLGRSYGDSCLNDGGVLLDMIKLDRFLSFDPEGGLLRCEAGISLSEILNVFVPRGWFLPVTPGTKFVTVGGAIANDIHGKNHHRAGTFGCHVTRFELLRSTGERLLCSPSENQEMFRATIGGLGLTGLILWAELRLLPIRSTLIEQESIRFNSLEEFFELSAESDQGFDYTVAWIDPSARGETIGRGLFLR